METLVLIDCNPSFSAYTEQAILAAERLVIPCSPDGASARAINNASKLLYGHKVPDAYASASFYKRVEQNGMEPPKIHLVLLNRSTIYSNKPSRAFRAMREQMQAEVSDLWQEDIGHEFFSNKEKDLFQDMPDAHTVAVVAAHLGMPIFSLRVRSYQVNDNSTQVNEEPLQRYKDAIESIIDML